MSTKTDPGEFDCYAKLSDDEPYFVLRAKDPLAPLLVRMWADLWIDTRGMRDHPKALEAYECASSMEDWRRSQKQPRFSAIPEGKVHLGVPILSRHSPASDAIGCVNLNKGRLEITFTEDSRVTEKQCVEAFGAVTLQEFWDDGSEEIYVKRATVLHFFSGHIED